jgi:hypothetical protein
MRVAGTRYSSLQRAANSVAAAAAVAAAAEIGVDRIILVGKAKPVQAHDERFPRCVTKLQLKEKAGRGARSYTVCRASLSRLLNFMPSRHSPSRRQTSHAFSEILRPAAGRNGPCPNKSDRAVLRFFFRCWIEYCQALHHLIALMAFPIMIESASRRSGTLFAIASRHSAQVSLSFHGFWWASIFARSARSRLGVPNARQTSSRLLHTQLGRRGSRWPSARWPSSTSRSAR